MKTIFQGGPRDHRVHRTVQRKDEDEDEDEGGGAVRRETRTGIGLDIQDQVTETAGAVFFTWHHVIMEGAKAMLSSRLYCPFVPKLIGP